MIAERTEGEKQRRNGLILIFSTLLMAICGLIYELLAGTLSSYLLGDSVTQFSIIIGWYLSAMGLGSFFSRYIKKDYLVWLIGSEVLLGLIGGSTGIIAFSAFTYTDIYQPILLTVTGISGILVGLEIPLMIILLKEYDKLNITVANVMTADYIGALGASLLFPFILIPHLGLTRAGVVAGVVNILIASIITWHFRAELQKKAASLITANVAVMSWLLCLFFVSEGLVSSMENRLYQDEIIYSSNSKYQKLIVTKRDKDVRFFLNGHLQFSSADEYRYHEALVHVPAALVKDLKKVLILGGGDGMAVREVLKYKSVEEIDLVDLDPEVTRIFSTNPLFVELNNGALNDPRVKVTNTDAFNYLKDNRQFYDLILIDLPDPSDPVLAKLYSKSFYGMALKYLREGGRLSCQSTSPFRSREAFWCINETIHQAGAGAYSVDAYHVLVPSFGTWGFQMAGKEAFEVNQLQLKAKCRYLTDSFVKTLFTFPADMAMLKTKTSTLNDPAVIRLYTQGYKKHFD